MQDYVIRFNTEIDTEESDQYEDYVHEVRADLVHLEYDESSDADDDPIEELVGSMQLILFDVENAVERSMEPFFVLDNMNSDTANCASAVFSGMSFKDDVLTECDAPFATRLLILDRIEIDPKHRGRDLSLLVMRRAIQVFGENCLIVLHPMPLQYTGDSALSRSGPEFRSALRKLKDHYGRLGFVRIGATEWFGRGTAQKLPVVTLGEKCRGNMKRASRRPKPQSI